MLAYPEHFATWKIWTITVCWSFNRVKIVGSCFISTLLTVMLRDEIRTQAYAQKVNKMSGFFSDHFCVYLLICLCVLFIFSLILAWRPIGDPLLNVYSPTVWWLVAGCHHENSAVTRYLQTFAIYSANGNETWKCAMRTGNGDGECSGSKENLCKVLQHNFYFEGQWFLFAVCVTVFTVSWFAGKSASSMQTTTDHSKLVATKTIMGKFVVQSSIPLRLSLSNHHPTITSPQQLSLPVHYHPSSWWGFGGRVFPLFPGTCSFYFILSPGIWTSSLSNIFFHIWVLK